VSQYKTETNVSEIQILTAALIKVIAFWDVASCSLIEMDRFFRGSASIIKASLFLPDYTSRHSRKRTLNSSRFREGPLVGPCGLPQEAEIF
jgi:hypothetical protein